MEGSLVHLVNDPCTPERMAIAGVPQDLAVWYDTQGRSQARYSEEDVRQVMTVRSLVRRSLSWFAN